VNVIVMLKRNTWSCMFW